MNVCSLTYLLCLGVVAVAACVLRSARRRALLALANLAFLLPYLAAWRDACLLAVFIVVGYWIVRRAAAGAGSTAEPDRPGRASGAALAAGAGGVFSGCAITAVVAFLVYVKRYAFLGLFLPAGLLHHGLEMIGASYMTFKLIHMVVDAHQGALAPLEFACYANYQLGFFTLLAGPIQRYNDFEAYWRSGDAGVGQEEILLAWNRILNGVLKAGILGTLALKIYDHSAAALLTHPAPRRAILEFLAAYYAYPFYIYFNFAGYCDVVIGSARLLGLTLPENFNFPFAARNMIDFWNRWHITLTHWIRDYVFMASYKWAGERWESLRVPLGYFFLFLALFIAGVWHGSTWNFVMFGALQGLGVMAAEMYGDAIRRAVGRPGLRRYLENPWARRAAVCATFHYVCASFLFFDADWRRTLDMIRVAASAVLGRA